MVSETENTVTRNERGFVTSERLLVSADDRNLGLPLPSFGGSILSGAVVILSLGALSGALMFGCHVGVQNNGELSFGPGASIWMIVTACIAYFVGGRVTTRLSLGGGWLRGLVLWGFTIPFMMIIAAIVTGSAGLAYAHTTHVAEQLTNNTGLANLYAGNILVNYPGAWIAFIASACGLVFSVFGASFPTNMNVIRRNP